MFETSIYLCPTIKCLVSWTKNVEGDWIWSTLDTDTVTIKSS